MYMSIPATYVHTAAGLRRIEETLTLPAVTSHSVLHEVHHTVVLALSVVILHCEKLGTG